jgi:GTPase SAR1 family protein
VASNPTKERIKRLEEHLKQENPVLAGCVKSFQRLDRIQRKLGLMKADESLATQVSWWPAIAILGTYSAGKSTFINQYVGSELQRTGNQAVDDKFTVLCYGTGGEGASLPGLALDSDPRFPFYQISHAIEEVAAGEGRRVDSYLQLKTTQAESLRGKILIDSPGFDADQQRTSTLLIINHIINLSDLVLVFFDARHPEPGAMADTLRHLVADTVQRTDATKFLYVLNQIDNTAREDNPEEVVAAWQRALSQHGLTAGRFYRIYARDRDVASPISDEGLRERFERKRDEDLADIEARIHQVEVERAYRVVGVLEKSARHVRDVLVPRLAQARRDWRRRTFWFSIPVFAVLLGLFLWWSISGEYWNGFDLEPFVALDVPLQITVVAIVALLALLLHSRIRALAGKSVLRSLQRDESLGQDGPALQRAFEWNLRAWWTSLATTSPRGWGQWQRRRLESVLAQADEFVQNLNDRHARPSGNEDSN